MSDAATYPARSTTGRPDRLLSPFEFWPGWLFYAPVIAQWIALGLRYGDMSLPTAANPHIETGGLCGESKADILGLGGKVAQEAIAPWCRFEHDASTAASLARAEQAVAAARLDYPLILKPDIGCNGAGVRLIPDVAALARALPDYPTGVRLVLQQFVPWEGEAGLFYVRLPHEAQGRLTSLTLKEAPCVVGDGRSTLRALILADPRAGRVPQLYLPRLAGRLDEVPASGERVRLVLAGNHCRGSIFRNGTPEITPALTARVEAIARDIPEFHFGRFDVRFESLAALRRGENFKIIEVNGAGSEPTHIWDARTTLREAWVDQFVHYRAAWEIGRANRKRGHRASGLPAMYRAWRLQRRLMASYPIND